MTLDRITSFVAVREALNKADSQRAQLFSSLIDNGKNHPFDCTTAARQVFGPKKDDFPSLGKKQSPFDSSAVPSIKELQEILVTDLQSAKQRSVRYINSESQTDEDERHKQLNTLTDSNNDTSGGIWSFPSPSLDEICGDGKIEYENVVHESMTEASILPRDTLLSLQHSNEGTTFTTLLSGSLAWIIWPPTKQNLGILQNYYVASTEDLDDSKVNLPSQLIGGVCLVQTVGDAMRLPPFCPLMCLSLERSVLATHFAVTATQLVDMLHKLPLLLAWFKTEHDGELKRDEFVAALLPHMSAILQGDFESVKLRNFEDPYEEEGPLRTLLKGWIEIKHAVASILKPSETQQVITMWSDFLIKAKGRKCWICGWATRNKRRDLPKHFASKHWRTADIVEAAERRDEKPEKSWRMTSPQDVAEEGDEDPFHDAMEVIELRPDVPHKPAEEAAMSSIAQEQATSQAGVDEMGVFKGSETPVHFC
ncbi:hypothetical protein E8E12_010637 [Didymella heteroderae]|uniref:Uncharacterized protein n=1 Tax=Didymella heteroderae TaxID=1769908 RepID=A0A9P4X1N8_9PLEO|nr:hypothetical protein E8E12_010637 [Didymella heteroderae]